MQALVDKNSKSVLNSLADWKPVQLIAQIVRDGIKLALSQDQAGRRASTDCSLFISSLLTPASKLLQ